MLCVRCGKRQAVREGLCKDCYLERIELKLPKRIELERCECGAIRYRGSWKKEIDGILRDILKRELRRVEFQARVKSYRLTERRGKFLVEIEIEVKVPELHASKTLKRELELVFRRKLCTKCIRKRGGYYEAKVQLRELDEKKVREIVARFEEELSRVEELKNGVDLYFISKSVAKRLVNELKQSGFVVKHSVKLVGMKGGKKLFREIYSVKPLNDK